MELGKFIDLLFKRSIEITSYHYRDIKTRKSLVPWWFVQGTRELADKIDFNKVCQFDKKGRCGAFDSDDEPKFAKMCCCYNCKTSLGYLKQVPKDIEILRLLAKNFNEKTGFWRIGGCVLPRKYRSETCLTYICFSQEHRRSLLSDKEKLIMEIIGNPYKYYMFRFTRHICTDIKNFVEYELKKIKKGKQKE